MGMGQNFVPLVNIKIAGKWMFIPLKMVLIGIDPYPNQFHSFHQTNCVSSPHTGGCLGHSTAAYFVHLTYKMSGWIDGTNGSKIRKKLHCLPIL